MSKRRVPSPVGSSRGPARPLNGERIRFLGLALSGGKADKAALAVLDFYPKHRKLFLTKLYDRIRNEQLVSADSQIHDLIEQNAEEGSLLAIDGPWRLPQCMTCTLKCPGFERCREPHIEWMWEHFKSVNEEKKPKRIFTPYTQRCVEMYAATALEESFQLNSPLGANAAPLLARAHFILRRAGREALEVSPKMALWRVGRSLGVSKTHLRSHRRSAGGDDSRKVFLDAMAEHGIAFLYAEDARLMIEHNHAFEAFLCALTAFLRSRGWTEKRPAKFPKGEDWVEFPVVKIPWKEL